MAPAGVLKRADRGLVEVIARALDSFRQLTQQVVTKSGDVVEIEKHAKAADAVAIRNMLGALGCTPVDRSKIVLDTKDKPAPSGFDAFGPPN